MPLGRRKGLKTENCRKIIHTKIVRYTNERYLDRNREIERVIES